MHATYVRSSSACAATSVSGMYRPPNAPKLALVASSSTLWYTGGALDTARTGLAGAAMAAVGGSAWGSAV